MPRVFISYSHDSPAHMDRVLELSDHLREDGVDCRIDQYEISPPEGWPKWMTRQIEEADFVLVVCTEIYSNRFRGDEESGKGLGAQWEGAIITQELYEAAGKNKKFIPAVFSQGDSAHILIILRGATRYDLSSKDGYELLYRHVTNQPRIRRRKLGAIRPMPPRERKIDFFAPVWNVPISPNPFFTGCREALEKLPAILASRGKVALTGISGIGKSQAAAHYAYSHRSEYKAVLWSGADSVNTLYRDFSNIAAQLDLREKEEREEKVVVGAVHRWLESNTGWLLILDNAEDLAMVRQFIPTGGQGHLLLTTQAYATGAIAEPIRLTEMPPENDGALLLLRRGKLITGDAPLDAATRADREVAIEIARELGGLPLALDQAGAYVEETACGLGGYLTLYRQRAAQLLSLRGATSSDHPDSVATTFALACDKIQKSSPAAFELLRLCAYLHPDSIPEEIFTQGTPTLGTVLQPLADPVEFNAAIQETLRYSILRQDPDAQTLSIHRLVQAVISDGIDPTAQREWAERAVRAVNQAFPLPEFSKWPKCERLIPHILSCAALIEKWSLDFPEAGRLLNEGGRYLNVRARYPEAEPLYKRSLAIWRKALGLEHPKVALGLENYAKLLRMTGLETKAGKMDSRARTIRDKHAVNIRCGEWS